MPPKFVHVITLGISTTMQNFIQISLGVSLLRIRDFAPLWTKWLGYFGGRGFLRKATAETRAPILTQNTSNDAVRRKKVPFWGGQGRLRHINDGANAPWKEGGRFLQKLRGKCVNYLFVCGQRGCHSSHHEVNAQPPAPSAPSQPVRSVPAPAMGNANPQSNWQRGSSQGERAPPANVTPRPQSN